MKYKNSQEGDTGATLSHQSSQERATFRTIWADAVQKLQVAAFIISILLGRLRLVSYERTADCGIGRLVIIIQ